MQGVDNVYYKTGYGLVGQKISKSREYFCPKITSDGHRLCNFRIMDVSIF